MTFARPLFYGLMMEETNHAYDGGLYAELLQNRNFQENAQQPASGVYKERGHSLH